MANRKPLFEKKKEKPEVKDTSRKPSKGVVFNKLPDAVVDGKWIIPVGGEALIVRKRSGRDVTCICVVKEVKDDHIETWDATAEQWFVFTVPDLDKHGIRTKVYSMEPHRQEEVQTPTAEG